MAAEFVKKKNMLRFVCFACVGSAGTAVQYVVLAIGVSALSAPAPLCSAIGYLLGAVANYRLNYRFTFRSNGSHTAVASKYALVLAIGWTLNLVLMTWWVHGLHWNHWVAQILTTSCCLIGNFAGSNMWAFKPSSVDEKELDAEGNLITP